MSATASDRSTSAARASSPIDAMRDAEAPHGRSRRRGGARGQAPRSQGLVGARCVRPCRAQPRARPARLRLPARVQHVRADAVPRRRPRPALRRHPRPQPRDGRLLRGRRAPRAGRLRAVGHDPSANAATVQEAIDLGCGAILVPVGARARRAVAHPSRQRSRVARARGERHPVHAAHRRRRPARCGASSTTTGSTGHRLPRRRREHPLEGLHGDPHAARDLPRPASCSTACSSASPVCAAAASSRARCGSCRG